MLEVARDVVVIRSLLEDEDGEEEKKIDVSREFYERHEWIQRNIAERLELHRKLREQRAQQQERD